MKNYYPTCFALLLAGNIAFPSSACADKAKDIFGSHKHFPVAAFSGHQLPTVMQLTHGAAQKGMKRVKSDGTPDFTLENLPGYGFITGPDGTDWYFTQKYIENDESFYTQTTVDFYNGDNENKGQIVIDFGENSKVNYVMPYGVVTKKFFDNDANTSEVLVYVHEVTPDYTGKETLLVYNTKGELVKEMNGYMASMFEVPIDPWSSYQRLLVAHEEVVTDDKGNEKDVQVIDVMTPAGWDGSGIQVEKTFTIDFDLMNYCDGPCFSAYNVNGKPYYVVSKYQKPYSSGYNGNGDIIVTEDNQYELTVYDKNYEEVNQIAVPLVKPDDMLYRFAAFGMFSNLDMTRGRYTGDNQLNYVVTYYDYSIDSDAYKYTFDVYNESGEKVKNISKRVDEEGIVRMADLAGHEEQWCFGHTDADGGQSLEMVDIPSCTVAATIPSEINGNSVSTIFDRYPKGEGYQYVMSLRNPSVEDNGDVCAQIAWYNQDLSEDHIVKINLGPNGRYCMPHLNAVTLNPYLFNTSDSHEYIYLSSIGRTDSDVKDIVLGIADSEGAPLYSFMGDVDKGAIRMVSILNSATAKPKLLLSYYDMKGDYTLESIALPLEKFSKGGDGTPESPYLVSTVGDLMQVAADPAANYKQTTGIDLSKLKGSWTPLPAFTGVYDGDGNAINRLTIEGSDAYKVGLFTTIDEGAEVKNLFFNRPKLSLNKANNIVGVVAGDAVSSKLTNVHVYDAEIIGDDEAAPSLGGLLGSAALDATISSCSFNRGNIKAPMASPVGGISGDLRTSAVVKAASVSGNIEAESALGGVCGLTVTYAQIVDSHVNANLKAKNTVGGIVGDNGWRGQIFRCYAEGKLEATEAGWNGLAVGGIIGDNGCDWNGNEIPIVKDCVANVDEIIVPELADGEEPDLSVHRVVGRSILNDYDPDFDPEPLYDKGLVNNYANADMLVGGATVSEGTAADVEGQSVAATDLITSFFESLGYVYGNTEAEPWTGEGLPILYYEAEQIATGVETADRSTRPELSVADGAIRTDLAARIDVYAASGRKVASSDRGMVPTQRLATGVYVVVVTAANGSTYSQKVLIK